LKRELSEEALWALAMLEPWYRAGASSSLANEGAAVALELNTFFRFVSTKLAFVYGGGESGLAYFLKTASARIQQDPHAELTDEEQQFIDQSLATAWEACQEKYGDEPELWKDAAQNAVSRQRMGYYESLDQFPTLDRAQAVAVPPLNVTDGGTIGCQRAQSYTQWVPMHDPDLAQTILPFGQSELPESATRTSTFQLWSEGKLHPAPLSREKIESLGVTHTLLNYAN
jgi:acyl-homoserine lactone acylase PvdQ